MPVFAHFVEWNKELNLWAGEIITEKLSNISCFHPFNMSSMFILASLFISFSEWVYFCSLHVTASLSDDIL